jgi:TrmH family RNA methyltransferase
VNIGGEIINSRQNKNVVRLMKLSDRRARETERVFRFDGVKLLCEAIKNGLALDTVFVKASATEHVRELMERLYGYTLYDVKCRVLLVSDELFDKISEENSPEGVITVAEYIDKFHKSYIIKEGNTQEDICGGVLLLESVRDPQNVGAVIRSAAALGISRIAMSEDCADIYNPRTVRAAMGTLFTMPIVRVDDLPEYVSLLRANGCKVYAAALDSTAVALGSFQMEKGTCVAVGNEGHGLSDALISACDGKLYIPMRAGTESLNAAVAAALIMWEMSKL